MDILKGVQNYLTGLEEEIGKKWIIAAAAIIFVLIAVLLGLVLFLGL